MQMVPNEMLHLNQPRIPAIYTASAGCKAGAEGGGVKGWGESGGLGGVEWHQTRPQHKAAMNSISRNNERIEKSSLKCKTQPDTVLRL